MTAGEELLLLMFVGAVGIWCGVGIALKHVAMAWIALLILAVVIGFVYFVVLHGSITITIW
ncbi:MAG TPA: hypothetical protein VKB35_03325 [Ktedonobacteraceae bacterium]|nr:hypothetical protein [Ktedonobacteraceae bacterium]